MKSRLFFVAAMIAAAPALAQHPTAHDAPANGPSARSPYAGLQGRTIKALSEDQIADLRAGKGMSLALPAELNGYPGPSHVLELAAPLRLSEEQRHRTQALFRQMQMEAKRLGEELIASEDKLDRLFREGKASVAAVEEAAAATARKQGRLRAAHLRYHVLMLDVLAPSQVDAYARLRGYR